MFGGQPWGFAFPVLRKYDRGDNRDGVLVDTVGAIPPGKGLVTVVADELPFRASVMQQENGLGQFLLEGATETVEIINLPAAA